MRLFAALASGDDDTARALLAAQPALATETAKSGATRQNATAFFLEPIRHYVYAGDSALHIAAAAYRQALVALLLGTGGNPAATNRRGATPLHYAVDAIPGASHWNPAAQAATIEALLAAGADPNATDDSGVTPLQRAVRNRAAAAVALLLRAGADPDAKNRSGSTAHDLAQKATGRSGAGSDEAKEQQRQILELLRRR